MLIARHPNEPSPAPTGRNVQATGRDPQGGRTDNLAPLGLGGVNRAASSYKHHAPPGLGSVRGHWPVDCHSTQSYEEPRKPGCFCDSRAALNIIPFAPRNCTVFSLGMMHLRGANGITPLRKTLRFEWARSGWASLWYGPEHSGGTTPSACLPFSRPWWTN